MAGVPGSSALTGVAAVICGSDASAAASALHSVLHVTTTVPPHDGCLRSNTLTLFTVCGCHRPPLLLRRKGSLHLYCCL